MRIHYHKLFPESPGNPARVYVPTGDIEINLDRWNQLSDSEKEFVLRHEEGHYANQTFDENEADNYALHKMALQKPYSLTNHINAVKNISHNNATRVRNAQLNALRIAASDGSTKAQQLLGAQIPHLEMAAATGQNMKGNIQQITKDKIKGTTPNDTVWLTILLPILGTIIVIGAVIVTFFKPNFWNTKH